MTPQARCEPVQGRDQRGDRAATPTVSRSRQRLGRPTDCGSANPLTIGPAHAGVHAAGNGNIAVTFPSAGLYLFALDTTNPAAPLLTVEKVPVDVPVFVRGIGGDWTDASREPDELRRWRHLVAQQGGRGRPRMSSRSRAATGRPGLRRRSGRRHGDGRHAARGGLRRRHRQSRRDAGERRAPTRSRSGATRGGGRADRDRPVTAER